MSSYYAYCEWAAPCPYCGCKQLVQLSYDVTCTQCGAEQGYGNFVDDQPSHHYQDHTMDAPMSLHQSMSKITSKRVIKASYQPKGPTIPMEMFDTFMECSTIPENVFESAKVMYCKYVEATSIRGDKARKAIVAASIYYASRAYTPLEVKELLRSAVDVAEHDFSKACKEIKEVLGSRCEYKEVMIDKSSFDITHDINKCLARITCLPSKTLSDLRKPIFQLSDRIISSTELATLPQMTIAATLLYMATRIKKIKVTLKALCDDLGVTTTTVIKTEAKILEAISIF